MRNCSARDSVNWNVFSRAMSKFSSPGPKNDRRDALPGVPSAFTLNAEILKYGSPLRGLPFKFSGCAVVIGQIQAVIVYAVGNASHQRVVAVGLQRDGKARADAGDPGNLPAAGQTFDVPVRSARTEACIGSSQRNFAANRRRKARASRSSCTDCRDRKCSTPDRSICCRCTRSGTSGSWSVCRSVIWSEL